MNQVKRSLLYLCIVCCALLLAACSTPAASPTGDDTTGDAAPNRLVILDWAGYDLPEFFEPFTAAHPDATVDYTYMEQDSDAFAKLQSGFEVDMLHPCSSWWGVYVENGLVQPIDTSRLSNWDSLVPEMTEVGQFNGEQYFVPWEWGYDSILVRTDKVDEIPQSWADLWNPAYAGHLAIADMPDANRVMTGLALGYDDPYTTTPEQFDEIKQKLVELKNNALTYWVDSTELTQLMASGDVWVASNVWPDIYAALRDEGIPVEYIQPEEGRLGWVCGYGITTNAQNVDLAYDFLDALIAPQSMANMANMYSYGAANADAVPLLDESLVELFQFDQPEVLQQTNFYRSMTDEERQQVTSMWDEVKTSQ